MAKKQSSLSPMGKKALSTIFKKAVTTEYPFVKATVAEGFRGKQVFDISLCIGCGLCSKDCPAKAIKMIELDGKKRPVFLLDRCIFCYQCADSCPKNAIQPSEFFELATTSKSSLVVEPTIECKNGDTLQSPKDQ